MTLGQSLMADRAPRYGPPAENFGRIALIWEAILGRSVTREQVALCMLGVKLARLVQTPHDHDSLADLEGYTATMRALMDE